MTLRIKNMVCPRCITAVRRIFDAEGIPLRSLLLGEAEIDGTLSPEAKSTLAARLEEQGFELLEDRRSQLIEAIRKSLIELVHTADELPPVRLSDYLSERLGLDYKYLSTLFSETQGRTVEKYFIALKIERVKELLVYEELTLSEIAFRLGYSSVAHLSAQFKQQTGLTPSSYRRARDKKRRALDRI